MFPRSLLLSFSLISVLVTASPTDIPSADAPTVQLDNGIFTGKISSGPLIPTVKQFLGIPFALPPVEDRRYDIPHAIPPYSGTYNATEYGPSCIQKVSVPGYPPDMAQCLPETDPQPELEQSEDCLTVNVITPEAASPSSKLPVIVWIYGGGFEVGSTKTYEKLAPGVVRHSITLGTPVIYVSMNYRVGGLGFLASKEVKNAGVGNLGLHDQREALRWVQRYITQFGGDPDRVTLWGESAGAISISLQMLVNQGQTEGLFHGAFMQSGAPIPMGDITNGQKYFDFIASEVDCTNSINGTLACLRTAPLDKLTAAINKTPGIFSYQSLNLAWAPRTDGVLLVDNPQELVRQNKVANIPYITGNCEDEGTLFSDASLNLTNNDDFKGYVKEIYFPSATDQEIQNIANVYPDDVTQGSPFGTGFKNAKSPQYKRIAAFQGDGVFQAPRRWLLTNTVSTNHNAWSFLSRRLKDKCPFRGAFHGSDLLNTFSPIGDMAVFLINFANNADPNGPLVYPYWPRYILEERKIMTFQPSTIFPRSITVDAYRAEAFDVLTELSLKYPL